MRPRIEAYLAYAGAVRGLSPATVTAYRGDLERFDAWLSAEGLEPEAATEGEIGLYLASLVGEGKAASSAGRSLSAIKGLYRYLRRFEGLASDPAGPVEGLPRGRPLPPFLFEGEMATLLDGIGGEGFADRRDRALFEFLYSSGCRVSEASHLAMRDLDLKEGRAKVMGKGGKERIVFVAGRAASALADYLPYRRERLSSAGREASPWLFVNARGGRLTERGVSWILDRRLSRIAAAGGSRRRIGPHGFRHSFATHLVNGGADIRVVQEMLGHASVSTTQVYAHVDIQRLRDVYSRAHPHGSGKG